MESSRKVIVGYDLGDEYSQISCYSYKTFEPESICISEEEEEERIPTVLCVKKDTRLWLYGKEAIDCAKAGEGALVDSILEKVSSEEDVVIFDTKFSGVELLERYLRKTLTLIKSHFPSETITKLVVTVKETTPLLVNGIYNALSLLGIEKDRAVVISHTSSYLYYALSQDKALWNNDVGLFDFHASGLQYYQISINRRSKPMIAGITKKDLSDIISIGLERNQDQNLGYAFESVANNILYKQIISTLYFTGEGFEEPWAQEVIKNLCKGRRAFLGQNLYTKGACYAAKEFSGDQKLGEITILTDDMLNSSVGIEVYCDGRMKEVIVTEAAVLWYEVDQTIEVIVEEGQELVFLLKNLLNKDLVREKLSLDHLPQRPSRMTRLEIRVRCTSQSTVHISVFDRGFGEMYPETNMKWDFNINI